MPRVVHFEIQVDDIERAKKFYGDVFGWTFKDWESDAFKYTIVMTALMDSKEPGINGGMYQRPSPAKVENGGVAAYVCTIGVDDAKAYSAKIKAAGGTIVQEPQELKGVGVIGQFKDTEGNLVGIITPDPMTMPASA